jgi:hypothetical protein
MQKEPGIGAGLFLRSVKIAAQTEALSLSMQRCDKQRKQQRAVRYARNPEPGIHRVGALHCGTGLRAGIVDFVADLP